MSRLYLCDDERHYRELVKVVLKSAEDLDVVGEAGSARACIEDAPTASPDVILLDINMPGMTGLDALPRLREAMPDVRLLILTSAQARDFERDAIERGAHGFIEKPNDVMELPGMIRRAVESAA